MIMKGLLLMTQLVIWIHSSKGIPAGQLPKRWTYKDSNGDTVQVISAQKHFEQRELSTEEHARYKRCRCYCRRKWENNFVCCDCADSTCFPETAHVTMATGVSRAITELTPGDKILTADIDGQVHETTMLGFVVHQPSVISRYITLTTESKISLSLSHTHIVFVADSGQMTKTVPKYAAEVVVGDHVMVSYGNSSTVDLSRVTDISVDGMKGAYVPLTEHGTLLVDDVMVSCYASFSHQVAHLALAPLRWFPWLLDTTPPDGINPYVDWMKTVGRAVLPGRLLAPCVINDNTSIPNLLDTNQPAMQMVTPSKIKAEL